MKKQMKNNKGITLIALVITIIVLLILAGVSIAMLTGDNGLLTKAREAKTKSATAEAEEAVKIALATILANKNDPTYEGSEDEVSKLNLEALIEKDTGIKPTATVTEPIAPSGGNEGTDGSFSVVYKTSSKVTVTVEGTIDKDTGTAKVTSSK